jgi:hypothetical protein
VDVRVEDLSVRRKLSLELLLVLGDQLLSPFVRVLHEVSV